MRNFVPVGKRPDQGSFPIASSLTRESLGSFSGAAIAK